MRDVRDTLDSKGIDVRNRRRELEALSSRDTITQFATATQADLLSIAAPLMQWRNVRGDEDAYRFDLLIAHLEDAVLKGSPRLADLRAAVEAEVTLLMRNQNPVKAKAAAIKSVESKDFWANVTVAQLEEIRAELRGIMKFQQQQVWKAAHRRIYDVSEDVVVGINHTPKLDGLGYGRIPASRREGAA